MVEFYTGKDPNRYHEIMQMLDAGGIKYRGKEYTATSRIAMHALQIPQVPISKGPTVTPYEPQARLLSQKKLDVYYVEVPHDDLAAAHKCIQKSELFRAE